MRHAIHVLLLIHGQYNYIARSCLGPSIGGKYALPFHDDDDHLASISQNLNPHISDPHAV